MPKCTPQNNLHNLNNFFKNIQILDNSNHFTQSINCMCEIFSASVYTALKTKNKDLLFLLCDLGMIQKKDKTNVTHKDIENFCKSKENTLTFKNIQIKGK